VFLFFFARYFFHNKLIVKIRQTSRKLTCALHICSFSTEIKKVPAVISALQFRRQTQAWVTRQSNVTDKIMTSFQRNSDSRCACYICAWAQPQRWVDFVHRVHPLTLLLWPSTSAALPPSLSSSSVLLVLLTVDVLALPLALSSLKLSPFAALVPCPLLSLSLSLSLLLPCRAVLLVSFCFDRIREPGEGARATAAGSGRRRWVGAFPAGDGRGSVRRRGGRFARGQAVRGRRSGAGDGARTPLACLRVRVRRAENR
jgi:hypothetical protein